MIKNTDSLPWPLLVGAKFIQIHPLGTPSAVVLSLLGQIAMIGAFLLPIKIIMLMAGDGIPGVLPASVADLDKKVIISGLAGLSFISYLFYQASTRIIDAIAASGVRRIEKRTQKLHLFEGQHELTKKSYTRYIDTVASFSFVFFGTLLLLFFYPEIAITFLAYTTICTASVVLILKQKKEISPEDISVLQQKIPTLTGAGFFLIFLWIMIDYIFFTIPNNFLILLIAAILGRQLLSQAAVAANSLIFLHNQKQKLQAILFHRETLQPTTNKISSFWAFLEPDSVQQKELQELLETLSNAPTNSNASLEWSASLEWRDSGLPGIAFLNATNNNDGQSFLIKIFDRNKSVEALHEAALLLDQPDLLPSPKLVATQLISGHHIHIFDLTEKPPSPYTPNQAEKDALILKISEVKISDALMSRYTRSHQMLWETLNQELIHKILLAHPRGHVTDELESGLKAIQETLKNQPITLFNPQINNLNLWVKGEQGSLLLHWGSWSLEPYGSGLSENHLKKINSEEGKSAQSKGLSTSATAYQMIQGAKRNQFKGAIAMIKEQGFYLDHQ
jgi:hypothetical protein